MRRPGLADVRNRDTGSWSSTNGRQAGEQLLLLHSADETASIPPLVEGSAVEPLEKAMSEVEEKCKDLIQVALAVWLSGLSTGL